MSIETDIPCRRIVCDRCGARGVMRGPDEEFWELQIGWVELAPGRHQREDCALAAKHDSCGSRPQGHQWGTGWGWPKGEEKPFGPWVDRPRTTRYRMRMCRDCDYAEYQSEGSDDWSPHLAERRDGGGVR